MDTYYLIVARKSKKANKEKLSSLADKIGAKLTGECIYKIENGLSKSDKIDIHLTLDSKFRYCWIKEDENDLLVFSNDSYLRFCFERMKLECRWDIDNALRTCAEVLQPLERLIEKRCQTNTLK